jgi:hypothetical protein
MDLEALCRQYGDGQYVLVFDTGDGQVVSDHYATSEEISSDADLDLLAQYLIDRHERTGDSPKASLRKLVGTLNEREG